MDEKKLSDNVQYIHQNYIRAAAYHKTCLDENMENWRFYWAKNPELGAGQWPSTAIKKMTQQGKQLITYNFIKPTVDSIAGGILQIPFEPEFLPVNDEITSLTYAIKKAMYSDKEIMNWRSVYRSLVTHGLVHDAAIKIKVSTEFNDLGNIGFDNCLPGSVMPDPYWKSWSSKDCKKCWKESWFSALDLMRLYPKWSDRLKYEALRQKKDGDKYGTYTGINAFYVTDDEWGSLHRVIEEYILLEDTKISEWILTADGQEEIPKIPDEEKSEWLDKNHPGMDKTRVFKKEEKKKTCYVRTVCPTLVSDDLLENGPIDIQIERLPFLWWSASRENGEPQGIVSALKDPQININYGEAMINHKLQAEGGGGAHFSNKRLFEKPSEAEKFAKGRNKPFETFWLRDGVIEKGIQPSIPVQKSQFPSELYKNIEHIIDRIWPWVSKRPPASVGRPEPGNQTSGRLYELMKLQSDTMVYTIHYGLREFWNDAYEAYLLLAADIYSNELIPRTFRHEGQKITLNEPVLMDDGTIGIRNDVSQLKKIRHKVIISEHQESPTDKMNNVAVLAEYMRQVPPSALGTQAIIANEMANNIEQFSKETRDKIREIGKLEVEVATETLKSQKAQLAVQRKQAEMMLAQLDQEGGPQAAPLPLPGPGGPGGPGETEQPGMGQSGTEMGQSPPQGGQNIPQVQGAIQ